MEVTHVFSASLNSHFGSKWAWNGTRTGWVITLTAHASLKSKLFDMVLSQHRISILWRLCFEKLWRRCSSLLLPLLSPCFSSTVRSLIFRRYNCTNRSLSELWVTTTCFALHRNFIWFGGPCPMNYAISRSLNHAESCTTFFNEAIRWLLQDESALC